MNPCQPVGEGVFVQKIEGVASYYAWPLLTFLKACGRWGHVFATTRTSPTDVGPEQKNWLRMSTPPTAAHGGQYDATSNRVTFEQLLHTKYSIPGGHKQFGAFCMNQPVETSWANLLGRHAVRASCMRCCTLYYITYPGMSLRCSLDTSPTPAAPWQHGWAGSACAASIIAWPMLL